MVSDWLALHSLEADQTTRILLTSRQPTRNTAETGSAKALDARLAFEVQSTIVTGLDIFFHGFTLPSLGNGGVCWISEEQRLPENAPVTVEAGPTGQVIIFCGYRNIAADLIALTHEYGHALQIIQSNAPFIPPVDREVAAFLAEHILLAYLRSIGSPIYKEMQTVWQLEAREYLGADTQQLLWALASPNTAYDYRQNYPLAHIAAARLFRTGDKEQIWRAFNGQLAVAELLELQPRTKGLVG